MCGFRIYARCKSVRSAQVEAYKEEYVCASRKPGYEEGRKTLEENEVKIKRNAASGDSPGAVSLYDCAGRSRNAVCLSATALAVLPFIWEISMFLNLFCRTVCDAQNSSGNFGKALAFSA